jgi:hypothetical protein
MKPFPLVIMPLLLLLASLEVSSRDEVNGLIPKFDSESEEGNRVAKNSNNRSLSNNRARYTKLYRRLEFEEPDTENQQEPQHHIGGKRVALFGVQFEGNLGDVMETTPLLTRLSEWGVEVDCYLGGHIQSVANLDSKIKQGVGKFCKNMYPSNFLHFEVRDRDYDFIIAAPGPTVNHLQGCYEDKDSPNEIITTIWFGVGVSERDDVILAKQLNCLKFVALREPVSLQKMTAWMQLLPDKQNRLELMLSGDLSFSYNPEIGEVNRQKARFTRLLQPLLTGKSKDDWVLIFSKSNNFGRDQGIWIEDGVIYVTTILGVKKKYDIENVVFASSSDLEDHDHMQRFKTAYHMHGDRVITCRSIEEMLAIVSIAPEVITDRYHPGIAALMLGTKLTITKFSTEDIKLQGLLQMSSYKEEDIEDMNEKAFSALLNIIQL